ncbi:uncharacterized protein LOC122887519 [Siniperca chuatsi]|uniref:uncharacterized protein LOC122887519 n=1 Tax=Siniperca chuatsi TaxID=119488 RepID=UPI001CE17811|nr:uncharacterized protein LOC122887519 [Siniperca chuatsi]
MRTKETYLVGMVAVTQTDRTQTAVTQTDRIFKDPHDIGKFVGGKLGDVRSVSTRRSGMVIIDCISKGQKDRALKICAFGDHSSVTCFPLGSEVKKKGVVSGVPLTVEAVEGVCEARRLTRFQNGEKEDSNSVCSTFEGDLLERVYLDYVCYRVRPHKRAPLRCFKNMDKLLQYVEESEDVGDVGRITVMWRSAKCLHCEGNHHAESAQCPKRLREVKVNKIRAEKGMSYAEAAKRMERNGEMVAVQKEKEQKWNRDDQSICMDKKRFLAFIAMVRNCAAEITGKSERIKMVLDTARRFLNVGEDLDVTLREGVAPTQTTESGL